MLETIIAFLTGNQILLGSLASLIAILGAIWAIIVFFPKRLFSKSPKNQPHTSPEVSLSLETYTKSLETSIEKETNKLKKAHKKERKQLRLQIEELKKKRRDPEAALAKAHETIASLEAALTREGNEIGDDQMAKARTALEIGDFSLADGIFAQIEAREQLAVDRVARAAFSRGEIAEQQVRWADAAEHYEKAAKLSPNHANALNNLAGLYQTMGNYAKAEPLYLQAIKVFENSLGVDHPSTKTVRGNYAIFKSENGG